MVVERQPLGQFQADPRNPRQVLEEKTLKALAMSLRTIGQQVPVIAFQLPDGSLQLVDGHQRWQAAKLAHLTELDAVILPHAPTAAELCLSQLAIDQNRQHFTVWERAAKFAELKQLTNKTLVELAPAIGCEQGTLSKYLAIDKLPTDIKAQLQQAGCDLERAYLLSQAPAETQAEFAATASQLTRSELKQRIKPTGSSPTSKPEKITLHLGPTQRCVIQSPQLSLATVIDLLSNLLRELKKSAADKLDLRTVAQVLQDRAQAPIAVTS